MTQSAEFKRTVKHLNPEGSQFSNLLGMKGGLRVSIYFEPSNVHPESAGNITRFRSLLKKAKENLVAAGMTPDSADSFLEPLHDLNDQPDAWLQVGNSVAIFADEIDIYRIDNIEDHVTDAVIVSNRFHVKPLIPLLNQTKRFITLCLNLDEVRVYEGDVQSSKQVKIPDMPHQLQDVVWPDDPEKSLQHHTGSTTSATGRPGSSGETMWHGQGAPKDLDEDQKERMVHTVCRAFEHYLKKRESGQPLVIVAGVSTNIGLFRKHTTLSPENYRELDQDPSSLTDERIHEIARDEIKRSAEKDKSDFLSRLSAEKGGDKRCVDVCDVAVAAGLGRVDSCIVANDLSKPGVSEPEKNTARLFSKDYMGCASDLLDYIVAETVLHGGKAFTAPVEQIPDGAPVGAIFRY